MESESQTLAAKQEALTKIKEELKRAKEKATQSWLDSRPLIDELEKLKSALANSMAKNAESETLFFELEAELESVITSVRSKKEGELRAKKTSEELAGIIERTHEEAEIHRRGSNAARHTRSRLKLGLRVRKQKLQTLQLALVAARKESEAYDEAAKAAMKCSSVSETEIVKLSHEDYEVLKQRFEDENALAGYRISAALEEKEAAEKSRGSALAKWKGLKRKRVSVREDDIRVSVEEEELAHGKKLELVEIVEENPNILIGDDDQRVNMEQNYEEGRDHQVRRAIPKKKNNKKLKKRKKRMSFFMQIRQCFRINVIKRLFG